MICWSQNLGFLKNYINEVYLIYSLLIFAFISVFSLVKILQRFTYFEKCKITKGPIPTVPYGNFQEVVKQESSLHVFLWKQYNRFKRKSCKYGGLFLFMKPVILLVSCTVSSKINNQSQGYRNIFPKDSKLDQNDIPKVLSSTVLNSFIEKYYYSIKGALPEKLLSSKTPSSVVRDFLLESVCLAFGLNAFDIVDEINQLLKEQYESSFRYYLTLSISFLRNRRKQMHQDLKELLKEIMEQRKKNDLEGRDLIQTFMELYNDSEHNLEDILEELINTFSDTLVYSQSTAMLCLYEMALNKEIQEDLIGEIRRFNKKDGKLGHENLEELVYLEAVINETLRKYPPVATIITSKTDRTSTELEGYPDEEAVIFQSVLGVHRDPQYYTNPEDFDPDRFIEKRFVKDTYAPFGFGTRSQFYMTIVTLQVKLILISIFTCLKVEIKEDPIHFKYNPKSLNLSPCEDLNLSFARI